MEQVAKAKNLIYFRSFWEFISNKDWGYSFTKEELDKAEELENKYIGNRGGVGCYLQSPLELKQNGSS
jgi:hypothetical protein